SGLHFPSAVAIAVSQALFRTLKGRRLQLLGHLCVEYLVYDTLQQLSHTLVSTKKLVQYLAIYGNLVLGHPLQPPVGFVDQLNHYQEGDGPSYCYAILILEFTPSYRTLLVRVALAINHQEAKGGHIHLHNLFDGRAVQVFQLFPQVDPLHGPGSFVGKGAVRAAAGRLRSGHGPLSLDYVRQEAWAKSSDGQTAYMSRILP